ncbi:MAG TPA: helicase-related protein [Bryobacteraceae bacterium]|jgi:ERCC4-related helicase|nr:helicase-related protein [Bryobacteraceae bacterium]
MNRLSDYEWRTSYRHEDGNLVTLFYIPALSCAVQYDRMTGYFSADALALASRGIDELIRNDGRMRLIVGCTLDPDEQRAIGEGYDLRAAVEAKLARVPLEPPDDRARQGLGMLAWMVAQGHLDVRVAVPMRTPGIFHDKVAVITDCEGNRLSFSGSINETAGGWLANHESFHVYCSWLGGRETIHTEDEVNQFATLWDDRSPAVRVLEFPDALRRKLLEFLPKNEAHTSPVVWDVERTPEPKFKLLPDEYRRIVWTFVSQAARLSTGIRVGEMTSAITPWPHQVRTYTRFVMQWPCRLLIADEVGLGKTISAGLILRQAMLSGLAKRILILTPKSVQIQWQNELYEKFNLNVPIYDGANLRWRAVPPSNVAREQPVGRKEWQAQPIVLASSYLMRRADRQPELTEAEPWDLIVLDEAHHARRKGAGTIQERGPNALLGLMRQMKDRCASLLLLSATPMQVHPVEMWDLANMLGLPPGWAAQDDTVEQYFRLCSAANPSPSEFEYLARLFRDTEAHFGPFTEAEIAEILPKGTNLSRKKVVEALREQSSIRRKGLDAEKRRLALQFLQAASPLRRLMVRNTRELLRRYAREGKLALPIAEREPKTVVVEMTAAESALYEAVEDYIADTYNAASPDKRSAVGFVMTIYRRRLASSFKALEKTLVGRLQRVDAITEEDASQDELGEEYQEPEDLTHAVEQAGAFEERSRIQELLKQIARLGTNDSKVRRLRSELQACFEQGYKAAIVFTQYTDTMEYLREYLAGQIEGVPIASYSGGGGAWRDTGGNWNTCTKEEIKRRLKGGQIKLLICTDAAGEGLNMQFAGVIANYDLPWNPMKVEQRIGRIDRLGQKHPQIRVLNFAYRGTVEEDVFFTIGNRINLFQGIVGRLQPILSRLPRQMQEITLENRERREAARAEFISELEHDLTEAERTGFDVDATAVGSLEIPALPDAALTLADFDRILSDVEACPAACEVMPLDPGSYAVSVPGLGTVRVTTEAETFDYSSDNQQLFSPGGEAYSVLAAVPEPVGSGEGVAWLVEHNGIRRFIVQTEHGPVEVRNFAELIRALAHVGSPTACPYEQSEKCKTLLIA